MDIHLKHEEAMLSCREMLLDAETADTNRLSLDVVFEQLLKATAIVQKSDGMKALQSSRSRGDSL